MSAINIILNINKLSIKLKIKFYCSKFYKHYILLLGIYNKYFIYFLILPCIFTYPINLAVLKWLNNY